MKQNVTRILCALLCAAMLFGMLPAVQTNAAELTEAQTQEVPAAETTAAGETTEETPQEPAAEEPAEEVPEETVPEETVEEVSEETVPEEAAEEAPEETVPEEPAEEAPEETVSEETTEEVPEETAPEETTEELLEEEVSPEKPVIHIETIAHEEMPYFTIAKDVYDYLTFTDFADLKILAAGSYSEATYAYYVGEDPLVISEDLVLPANLEVDVSQLTVPAGVTLTAQSYLYAGKLVVKGTVQSNYTYVTDELTISGRFYNNSRIYLIQEATLTGSGNIIHASGWSKIDRIYKISDMAALKSMVAAANAETDSHLEYYANISQADVLVNASITIPENCAISVFNSGSITVAPGCTLENDSTIAIQYSGGGRMTVREGGVYTGSGTLQIISTTKIDPQDAVVGLDLTDFDISDWSFGNYYSWDLCRASGLPQLNAPTDLQWGRDGLPGLISWKSEVPDGVWAHVRVFSVGTEAPIFDFLSENYNGNFHNTYVSECVGEESGQYYFTVQYKGDYTSYRDSEIVKSPIWTYVKPSKQLGACGSPVLDWPYIRWEGVNNEDMLRSYYFEISYAETETAEPRTIRTSFLSSTEFELDSDLIENYGDGYYSCRVRALSNNIESIANGEWSETITCHIVDGAPAQVITTPMYRLYNPYTLEHLYTSSEAERDNLAAAGWNYEGIAWYAPDSGSSVFRLYNPYDDGHFYTMSIDEIATLNPLGWQVDGVMCYSASAKDGVPIYRLFNPYEAKNYHHYTGSMEECEFLVSLGWILEGIAWYGADTDIVP